jgi:hypothetical protein
MDHTAVSTVIFKIPLSIMFDLKSVIEPGVWHGMGDGNTEMTASLETRTDLFLATSLRSPCNSSIGGR